MSSKVFLAWGVVSSGTLLKDGRIVAARRTELGTRDLARGATGPGRHVTAAPPCPNV